MATVIGIFENQYLRKKPLTVVKPGTQARRFTHIYDTVQVCYEAFKSDKCKYYSISSNKSYSIVEVAKMFGGKIKYIPERKGERYESAVIKINYSNKIYKRVGKTKLKHYIKNFLQKNS